MDTRTSGDDVAVSFVAGDPDALRRVFDRHQRAVHSYCRSFVADQAGDVTQEVFLAAWQSRERFDPAAGSLSGWLMGIARYKVMDHLRSHYRDRSTTVGDLVDLASTDGHGGAEDASVERVAEQVMVAEALESLGEPAGAWIRAAFVDGLSHAEIAERSGAPLGTVKSTIRRGLLRIRRDLESFDAV